MIRLLGTQTEEKAGREAAHRLLAFAVSETWGLNELPAIDRSEMGKPFFPDLPQLHFNLSHSGPLVLCALSDEGEVGVDIELIKPRRPRLPRYVMSDDEFSAFDGSWEEFTRIWTLKEAYTKYLGRTIWSPASIPVPPPVPYRCYSGDGWRASLCAANTPPEEICWITL